MMSEPSAASLAMISRFIAFDTTSHKSNLPLIHFVRDELAQQGVPSILTFDDTGTKANLFATLGPADQPGFILSGHTDTVPVEDQSWSTDPFKLVRRGERLFGRGTCDMKSFSAVALALVPEFLARGLKTPIHLALSYDEEIGCIGVRRLIADLATRNLRPLGCIVGEPTAMGIVCAHKGRRTTRVRVRGLEAHSGVPHLGVNAIEAAAEVIAFFKRVGRRLREEGPHDKAFDTPNHATIQTSTIEGGTASNIVAGHCEFDVDIRYLPGQDPSLLLDEGKVFVERDLLPEMRSVSSQAGFVWETGADFTSFSNDEDSQIIELAKKLTGAQRNFKVGFGTEAGLFQEARIPTVVCGPGDIAQAHKPDEFIELAQVKRCENFLRRLMDRMA
ncbi:MAG: acetylornithine deacetylase [Hyphomicrobiales bacterium]|nr:acetylornithine deacetylase [Hyphomicrobiales bacterium]MBV9051336.1 acetylornithine deacetylase [Hyphomicrobiales bacterium]MBV9590674.1 acetylornithine deacetylase [Hyphomicrobiales bacterium]MBV9974990.1 acetylornithine deacetylase [Hyphomicrobiales bacterium]